MVISFTVRPGLVPGIHVFLVAGSEDVDGRDKPGHDELQPHAPKCQSLSSITRSMKVRTLADNSREVG
jgi:hypothetical protein